MFALLFQSCATHTNKQDTDGQAHAKSRRWSLMESITTRIISCDDVELCSKLPQWASRRIEQALQAAIAGD